MDELVGDLLSDAVSHAFMLFVSCSWFLQLNQFLTLTSFLQIETSDYKRIQREAYKFGCSSWTIIWMERYVHPEVQEELSTPINSRQSLDQPRSFWRRALDLFCCCIRRGSTGSSPESHIPDDAFHQAQLLKLPYGTPPSTCSYDQARIAYMLSNLM